MAKFRYEGRIIAGNFCDRRSPRESRTGRVRMTSDKPKQKDGFVLDAVLQGEPRQVWFDESRAKADAVKGLDSMLKQCRPDDLDNAPPPPASDNRGNLPTE